MNLTWWKTAVIYQVYPRSFADSNGDGIGDLNGIRSRLDYLSELGVDAVWLSPVYPSPNFDFGYDVSDYCEIDPAYGTLADFDLLVAEAHKRQIRIILDIVINHTSHRHPWFIQSSSSRDNPKRDWYLWADPKPGGKPPNNWQSVFGGSGWQFDQASGQYYFHMFLKEQPDLNWHNPAVRQAMLDVFRFWMERDVDGFRLDVFNVYFKDRHLRSNPVVMPVPLHGFSGQRHLYDYNQPELIPFLAELRGLLDEYSSPGHERYAVGETLLGTPEKTASFIGRDRLHAAFNLDFLRTGWSARSFSRAIHRWENALGLDDWPNYVLNNHDITRSATRYRSIWRDREDDARLKVTATLLLTLRGTPFLYYGEEIGMRDIPIRSKKDVLDLLGKKFWPILKGRDGCRSPMQWTSGAEAGFSAPGVKPWLPVNENAAVRSVETQKGSPRSLFSFYCQLIALRKSMPALQEGMYQPLTFDTRYLMAYIRQTPGQMILVALNFSGRRKRLVLGSRLAVMPMRLLLSSHHDRLPALRGGLLPLGPYEAMIIELNPC